MMHLQNNYLFARYLFFCFQVGAVVKDLVEEVDELFSNKDKEREDLSFESLPLREEPRL